MKSIFKAPSILRTLLIAISAALLCDSGLSQAKADERELRPAWPQRPQAPAGAPNIVVILLDDSGFADMGTLGGLTETPELDRLSGAGIRYSNFNTASVCSPTRAALLTGRNHHQVGFGMAEVASGFPGYNFWWSPDTVSFAEVLRRNGYSTAAFGKWHNTPFWEITPAGPFDRWPTNLGFEYFYGFMGGLDSQWEPLSLYRNTTPVDAPRSARDGYQLTADLADEAVSWLGQQASLRRDEPYFLYFATGGVHAPHHAPADWIERFRGRFDRGWDVLRQEIFDRQRRLGIIPEDAQLTPRPAVVPAWNSLSPSQRRLYARQMEVYAGFLAYTDFQIGRVIRAAQAGPNGDNTLIFFIAGDNGPAVGAASGWTELSTSVDEQLRLLDDLGGPNITYNYYANGWTWLSATPFPGWKSVASHFGGTRVPLVVSWPRRIRDRGVRFQFAHVNDVAATIYEATGIRFPRVVDGVDQQPLDGVSFAHTFAQPTHRSRHLVQYFEAFGNRSIYQDGWIASARHGSSHHSPTYQRDFASDTWELYHVDRDFSQARDLARTYPERLRRLRRLFDREARRNDVFPLGAFAFRGQGQPSLTAGRSVFDYRAPLRLQRGAMPSLGGRSFRITANANIPAAGAQGMILSYGGRMSGFAFYLDGDRLVFENHRVNSDPTFVRSTAALPRGNVMLTLEFTRDERRDDDVNAHNITGGTVRLLVNGQLAREQRVVTTLETSFAETLGVGRGYGPPVSSVLPPPSPFSGVLTNVRVELR
jgi:arylsulfatase A-like enzyme